ncbi:hypothetical protein F5Y14DRAFT_150787 [Nemania sp. NC0429]|nr:hypothetical protein F5Y14DRAFT_150787 [Nemania sp. NC0429]
MNPDLWPSARSTFGSRSVASRPRRSQQPSAAARWKPRGPFRLFDLPAELRYQILSSALIDCEEQAHVLRIFLVSRRLYFEAAEIFYHDIQLDITDQTKPPGLFAEPLNSLSPRLHVCTMDLKIHLESNLRRFNTVYIPLLRQMADQGNLRTLRLEIDGRFPRLDFWTGHWSSDDDDDDDGFCETEIPLLIGPDTNLHYLGPAFLAAQPFQTFLGFLSAPRIPRVLLYTSSTDHYRFWCECHRKLSSKLGLPCNGGSWRGKSTRLRVNQKHLLRLFRNARAAKAPTAVAPLSPSSTLARHA